MLSRRTDSISAVERSVLQPIDHYRAIDYTGAVLQHRQVVAIDLLRPALSREGGRALDVGCGDGLFLAELDRASGLTEHGWAMYGLDYSAAAIDNARRRPYTFEQCNVEEGIPHGDDSFDVVTAGEVIEHVYDPDRLLAEMKRVLRPGGRVVLTTPNLHAWYNRALFPAGIQPVFYETSTKSTLIGAGPLAKFKAAETPVGHIRLFNRRALVDLLHSEGLRPLAIRGSVFERLTGPAGRVDRLFSVFPTLASNLVVLASAD